MAQQVLQEYKSRRNRACLVQTEDGRLVVKTFREEAAFQKELQIYRLLNGQLPCAKVICEGDQTLTLTRLPGQTLVECLQQQEQAGLPVWEVWEKLVAWLVAFRACTGHVMTDVNLRNFLYDGQTNTLYGLDFEECSTGDLESCAATLAAHIRLYAPENTLFKQEIARYVLQLFACSCRLDADRLLQKSKEQEAYLLNRRNNRI